MTYEGLGEMFEGDVLDMCTEKMSLVLIGGRAVILGVTVIWGCFGYFECFGHFRGLVILDV
jgi:hypothetical protein